MESRDTNICTLKYIFFLNIICFSNNRIIFFRRVVEEQMTLNGSEGEVERERIRKFSLFFMY